MANPNRHLTASLTVLVLCCFAFNPARADDAAMIRQLEQQLADAVVKGDAATFDRLFAESFTHGSQSGRFRTKAEWMKGKRQGESAYVSFDSTDVQVRVSGDTAVVTGLSKPQWREGDRIASGQFRFLRVWAKRDGRWQAIAFQSTAVPTPSNAPTPEQALGMDEPPATREFSIKDDRPFLGDKQIQIWGLRCGNALFSQGVTERHVRNFDNLAAHGINCVGVYIQGSNGGHPNPEGGRNGYNADGTLKPEFARRLEWLVREADARGMVVMVGLFSPRKDQELKDEAAIKRACEETANFLLRRKLRNVFCDIVHEFNHSRIDHDIFREPHGAEKKTKLTAWFNKIAPNIEAGICPTFKSGTGDDYPGMAVRIIQKDHPIPKSGFVVNVETQRHDAYSNDGKFEDDEFPIFLAMYRQYAAAPNACMLFHSGWCQGITNGSGTGPNPEMGGYGKSEDDRGIRFYYEWVRDNIGRYEYPRHIKPQKPEEQSKIDRSTEPVKSGLQVGERRGCLIVFAVNSHPGFAGCIPDSEMTFHSPVAAVFVRKVDGHVQYLVEKLNEVVRHRGPGAFVCGVGEVGEEQLLSLKSTADVHRVIPAKREASQRALAKWRLDQQAEVTVVVYGKDGIVLSNFAFRHTGDLGMAAVEQIVTALEN